MIPLYTLFVSSLKVLNWFVTARASRYERQYTDAAVEAEKAVQPVTTRPGNSQKADALKLAKAQYETGRLVLVRDELENSYVKWNSRSENLAYFVERLTGWQGRFVPYFMGIIDVALVLAAAHYLGLPHNVTSENLREWVEHLIRKN
jgi:hypothetical protein